MGYLLSPSYTERLRALGNRLSEVVRKLEITRITPTGHVVIPEPDTHRPYTPGDDPRYIDWSLYARTGRFYIKSMLREDEGILHVLVDTSASMGNPHPAKRERALEAAAAFAFLTLLAGNRVQVHGYSSSIANSSARFFGEPSATAMLAAVEGLGAGSGTSLSTALKGLVASARTPEARVLVLSDLIEDSPPVKAMENLRAAGMDGGFVHLVHPAELGIAQRGNLLLVDPESARQMRRTVGYRSARRLSRAILDYQARTEEGLRARGARYLRASTALPFEDIVVAYLLSNRGI